MKMPDWQQGSTDTQIHKNTKHFSEILIKSTENVKEIFHVLRVVPNPYAVRFSLEHKDEFLKNRDADLFQRCDNTLSSNNDLKTPQKYILCSIWKFGIMTSRALVRLRC